MTLPSFRQNRVWLTRMALRPRFSHIRHKLVPSRIYLLTGRDQQSVSFPSPQHPEAPPLLHAVQEGGLVRSFIIPPISNVVAPAGSGLLLESDQGPFPIQ